jgi:hypothetical protein
MNASGKLIVSPEFGERAGLKQLTRDLLSRMERDLGTPLQWVAAVHYNTEHPHVQKGVHLNSAGTTSGRVPKKLRKTLASGPRPVFGVKPGSSALKRNRGISRATPSPWRDCTAST